MSADESDPKETLEQIAEKVSRIESQLDNGTVPPEDDGPRMNLTERRKEALIAMSEHGPASSAELKKYLSHDNVSSTLRKLYDAFYLNLKDPESAVYELSDWGQQTIESTVEQTKLSDNGGSERPPWKRAGIPRGQWVALKLIDGYNGDAPRTVDINSQYVERTGASNDGDAIAVSPRVTELYNDGLVDRTPKGKGKHRYWLTEEGHKVLEKGQR